MKTSGVDITYSLTSPLTLHEPVKLTFAISNTTSERAQVELGQDRKGAYVLTLIRPDGTVISLPQYDREGISTIGTFVLEPDKQFTQVLLLNEWYSFDAPGHYRLRIRLSRPILVGSISIEDPGFEGEIQIQPRNPEHLEAFVKALTDRIEHSNSYADAAEAATALSYTIDPISVPYLDKVLHAGKLVEPIAVAGLERIADQPAVEVLVASLQPPTSDVALLARAALERIRRQTSNPVLRQEIDRALARSGQVVSKVSCFEGKI